MISIFINSLTSGGAEKVVLTLLDKFREAGKEVELTFIEKEQFYEIPKEVNRHYLTSFETLEKSWLNIPYILICAYKLKNQVRRQNIPIVQSHLPRASFINVLARLMGARHHAQIIVHSRLNFEHKPWPISSIEKYLYSHIFQRADSVISICEVMKGELDTYLGLRHHPQHQVIYNPHNLEEIRTKAKEEIEDYTFLSYKKYLIFAGRIDERKRIGDIIEAFDQVHGSHPETILLIVGDGEGKGLLQEKAKALGLEEGVHFLGYQSNPFAFIARADLMILASSMEGLPNIIIESLACGTPVVSSDCISGPREILSPNSDLKTLLSEDIEEGTYGLLYPIGAVNLLAQAICRLLEQEDLYTHYKEQGYRRAEDFNAAKIIKHYLKSFPS